VTPFLGSVLSLRLTAKAKVCINFASPEVIVPGILNFEAIVKWQPIYTKKPHIKYFNE